MPTNRRRFYRFWGEDEGGGGRFEGSTPTERRRIGYNACCIEVFFLLGGKLPIKCLLRRGVIVDSGGTTRPLGVFFDEGVRRLLREGVFFFNHGVPCVDRVPCVVLRVGCFLLGGTMPAERAFFSIAS